MIEVELCEQEVVANETTNKYRENDDYESGNMPAPMMALVEKNDREGNKRRQIFLDLKEETIDDLLDDLTAQAVADHSIHLAAHFFDFETISECHFIFTAGDLDAANNQQDITARIIATNTQTKGLIDHDWSFTNALFLHRILHIPILVEEDFFLKFKAESHQDIRERLQALPLPIFGNYKIPIAPLYPSSL